MPISLQHAIAAVLQDDAQLQGLLDGGVWTRPIRRNDNGAGLPPTPGSTPDAFDVAGRIRRCVAVLNGQATVDESGALGTYMALPEVWFRCLPHATEKADMEEAVLRTIALLQGRSVEIGQGEAAILTVSARMMPVDDPELPPAVVDMIQVQAMSRWR